MSPCLLPLASPSLPPSLSHHSRWSQSTKLISLCYAAASHQLSTLRLVVYICPCHSLTLSQLTLPLYPQVHSLVGLHLYSCLAPRFFWPFSFFFRFHIYVLAYGICFSLSDLLPSVWQSLGPSTSLLRTQFRSFLWLSDIPLYICATSSLSIHLLMDTSVTSMSWLL